MEIRKPAFIPKSWDLPPEILRRLGDSPGRQRAMDEEGHLLLILHMPPEPEDDELRKPLLLWLQPGGEWKSTPAAGGLAALDQHLEAYRSRIHSLDEAVEAARTPRQFFDVMRHVNPLLRATRNLMAVLQEAREARPDERRVINFRDRAVDLERAIDLVSGDAKNGMDFALAENTEEQSRFAHESALEAQRLNRMAAFFFPLATLVGVFGMSAPAEVMAQPGFWAVLGAGIVAGLAIRFLPSRRS